MLRLCGSSCPPVSLSLKAEPVGRGEWGTRAPPAGAQGRAGCVSFQSFCQRRAHSREGPPCCEPVPFVAEPAVSSFVVGVEVQWWGGARPPACCRPHRVWGVHFWTGASGPPRGDRHTAGPAGPAGWCASELTGTARSPGGCVWPGPSQKSPAGRKPPRRAGRGPLAHVGLQKAPRPGPADSSRPAPQSRRSCAWTPTARSPPPACGCRSSAR